MGHSIPFSEELIPASPPAVVSESPCLLPRDGRSACFASFFWGATIGSLKLVTWSFPFQAGALGACCIPESGLAFGPEMHFSIDGLDNLGTLMPLAPRGNAIGQARRRVTRVKATAW